jgi:hypothetical protein
MGWVRKYKRQLVRKNRYGFLKADTMLPQIAIGLLPVPFKVLTKFMSKFVIRSHYTS